MRAIRIIVIFLVLSSVSVSATLAATVKTEFDSTLASLVEDGEVTNTAESVEPTRPTVCSATYSGKRHKFAVRPITWEGLVAFISGEKTASEVGLWPKLTISMLAEGLDCPETDLLATVTGFEIHPMDKKAIPMSMIKWMSWINDSGLVERGPGYRAIRLGEQVLYSKLSGRGLSLDCGNGFQLEYRQKPVEQAPAQRGNGTIRIHKTVTKTETVVHWHHSPGGTHLQPCGSGRCGVGMMPMETVDQQFQPAPRMPYRRGFPPPRFAPPMRPPRPYPGQRVAMVPTPQGPRYQIFAPVDARRFADFRGAGAHITNAPRYNIPQQPPRYFPPPPRPQPRPQPQPYGSHLVTYPGGQRAPYTATMPGNNPPNMSYIPRGSLPIQGGGPGMVGGPRHLGG